MLKIKNGISYYREHNKVWKDPRKLKKRTKKYTPAWFSGDLLLDTVDGYKIGFYKYDNNKKLRWYIGKELISIQLILYYMKIPVTTFIKEVN